MLALRTASGATVGAYHSKSWPLAPSRVPGARIYSAPPQTLQLLGGAIANYEQLYWTQPWCQAVINKLTRGIARLDWKVYGYDAANVPIEQPKAVPAKVMRAPYPRAGAFQMKEYIMGSLCVWGNSTLVKFRGGNGQTPAEVWPVPFQRMTIIEGQDVPILAYQYWGLNQAGAYGAKPITFLPEDVVHFSWFNPDGKPWGRSPLEALATTLALEDAGQRYALSHFGNNARPASFVTTEKSLTKEQRENLRREIDAAYGGPDNAFKVALLDKGLDWKPISFSARDSQLIDNRKFSREEVCAVYDIAPPLVGILDNATYSNIDTQAMMLYQETFGPILSMLDDTWNAQFIYPEPAWDGYFSKFDMGLVLRGNYEQRTQGAQREFLTGSITPNELRVREGRSPVGNMSDNENPMNWCYVPVNTAGIGPNGLEYPTRGGIVVEPRDTDAPGAAGTRTLAVKPDGTIVDPATGETLGSAPAPSAA